ncbi:D-alanyl-D-alanine carboxypeptidase family protein [Thermosediminibacter oceani]|uniref:serine-type D-Ala-D-Ala carboxypeptidase n=1 Tax=Thermosediminibacter oceani (strain ATCC BAA-1034 / DSM 16646 / JW/IW-1228P) TaxID=555079 RepID=D9S3P9_THEOJ|nr:D-alanyl-D-alanine carboxypeptidase family protein [Thermosediminibacter oceani]ADL08026.1 Serine-type D-Ala-D-Ala carboxypeptidase [Thermosediminibacter oceani DSM 16646]
MISLALKNRWRKIALLSLIFFISVNFTVYAQPLPEIKSPSAILIDAGTGTVLYEKNAHEKLEPASITKIMTLLVALEAIEQGKVKLTDKVKISERAWKTGGSQVFLGPGEEQTLETLLKCITIASANDASVAVAEYIGGSVEGFVKMMNDKAKALGMNNTNFTNPHGLSDPNHYTTAYDIALMSRELVKYPKFFEWSTVWIDYLEHTDKEREATMLANTNKLLGKYEGLDGLKTGFHAKAGYCFAGSAKRGDLRLISVVLNSPSSAERFEDTKKLLDYGFGRYSSVQVAKKNSVLKRLPVEKGVKKEVDVVASDDLSILVEKGKEGAIKTRLELPDKIYAPVVRGQKVGKLIAEQDGKIIGEVELTVSEEIDKAGLFYIFRRLLGGWFYF